MVLKSSHPNVHCYATVITKILQWNPGTVKIPILSHSTVLRIPGTVKIPMLSHSTVLRIPETVKIPIISPSTLLRIPKTVKIPILSHSTAHRIPETVKIPILSHSTVLRTPDSDFAVRRIQRSHIYLSKFVFKYLDETESQYLTVLACLSGELG